MIDHSGAVHRHGFVEDPVERRLESDRLAENPTHAARGKNGSKSRLLDCTRCGALRVGGEACRHCGFKPSPPAKFVATVDADLALVKRNGEVSKPIPSPEEKYRWLRELTAIAAERGYKPGWVAHKYREKFSHWPPSNAALPLPPTGEVRSWVRSRMISFAKGQQKGAA